MGAGGMALFECKFTEPGGGACSQPRPLVQGPHKALRQCNGNYEYQENPVTQVSARCALTAKGVKYWDLISEVLNVQASVDHRVGPLCSIGYKSMRYLSQS
jgi:hypothetical protein